MCRKPVGEGAKRVTTVMPVQIPRKRRARVAQMGVREANARRCKAGRTGGLDLDGPICPLRPALMPPWNRRAGLDMRPRHDGFEADHGHDTARHDGTRSGPGFHSRHRRAGDLATGKHHGRVVTRFPPEPNGYLHIGHAKSICLNFGLAASTAARATCASTTPIRPRKRRVRGSDRGRRALAGLRLGRHLYYASDYFEQLYAWAEQLIEAGHAYVGD